MISTRGASSSERKGTCIDTISYCFAQMLVINKARGGHFRLKVLVCSFKGVISKVSLFY